MTDNITNEERIKKLIVEIYGNGVRRCIDGMLAFQAVSRLQTKNKSTHDFSLWLRSQLENDTESTIQSIRWMVEFSVHTLLDLLFTRATYQTIKTDISLVEFFSQQRQNVILDHTSIARFQQLFKQYCRSDDADSIIRGCINVYLASKTNKTEESGNDYMSPPKL